MRILCNSAIILQQILNVVSGGNNTSDALVADELLSMLTFLPSNTLKDFKKLEDRLGNMEQRQQMVKCSSYTLLFYPIYLYR